MSRACQQRESFRVSRRGAGIITGLGTWLVLLIVGAEALGQAPPAPGGVVGIWEGPLIVGPIELRVAFHIASTADGKLTATMDSIDQGAKGIPCGAVTWTSPKLTIDVPKISGAFAGELAADGQTLRGEWTQSGMSLPLVLKRVEKPSTLNRPQHPKKPYPYRAEDVTFANPAAGGIELAGTLTLPKGAGPFPAVVLISGSGPQDRDETLLGHKPFLVLADHLTRQGIAVLRYDDRGVGKSGGQHEGATSADFATDTYAAVAYLKTRPEIDPKRIGLAGHSEGGIIAPMVAADHPDDIAFLVLMAGTGVRGDEISRRQLGDVLRAMAAGADDLSTAQEFLESYLAVALKPGSLEEKTATIKSQIQDFIASRPEDERKALGSGEMLVARLTDPWMLYFLAYDPRPVLGKVKCPVLAINGELDTQVAAAVNLPAIADALRAGGNTQVTTRALAKLNHLFQTAKTGALSEYGQIEETFAPEALTVISDWIAGLKGPAKP